MPSFRKRAIVSPLALSLCVVAGCAKDLSPPTAPRASVSPKPEAEDLRAAATEIAAAMGYAPFDDWRSFYAREGERHLVRIEAVEDRCYLVAAIGRGGIDAVSLRLLRRGRLLSADTSRRAHAWAAWCPEGGERMAASVEVLDGEGELDLGLFAAWRRDVLAWVGPPVSLADSTPDAETALALGDRLLAEIGYEPAAVLSRGTISAGERRPARLSLAGGRCAVLSVYPDSTLLDADISVRSDRGRVFAEASFDPGARLAVCAALDETFDVDVIAIAGEGRYILAANALTVDAVSMGDFPDPSLPLAEAAARLSRHGLVPIAGEIDLSSEEEGARTATVRLEAGGCFAVVVDGRGGALSDVVLEGPSRKDDGRRWLGPGTLATIALCPEETGPHRLVVRGAPGARRPPRAVLFAPQNPAQSTGGSPSK